MTYLDTGCFVKLYYPEPDSARVIAHIRGKTVGYTPLHELEFANALQLKIFFKSANAAQAAAARALVEGDLRTGVLVAADSNWKDVFQQAVKLAELHTASFGCRSLDVLHCAVATLLKATEFMSTDARQNKLAGAMGLNLGSF